MSKELCVIRKPGSAGGVAGRSSTENEEDRRGQAREMAERKWDGSDLALGTHHPLI